mmetsp:Transcript_38428/g.96670  ORF Transcript_38428/g.96670 Transcript_38428/m.96670 type:complete len:892 (+) Transcript_38428:258-2933(+)
MNGLLRVSFIVVLLLAALSAVHAQCAADDYLCCGPNGGCTDSDQDSNNCGGCGNVCPDGQVCCDGTCSVQTCDICDFSASSCGSTNACACCDGNAVDTDTDKNHCGSCNPCSGEDLCCGGECRDALNDAEACGCIANNCTAIGEGWGCCGGVCVDLDTDPLNCGTCFNNVTSLPGGCCVDGSVFSSPCDNCYEAADDQDMCCWNGTNTPQPCTGLNSLCCDGICIDPNSFFTCGCPSTECSSGESCCGEICVPNTDFTGDDRDNCGACGNQCDPNQFCNSGSCTTYDNTNCGMSMADCDSLNQFCCEDSCVDGDSDSQCGSLCNNCDDSGFICCSSGGGDFQCVNPMANGNCGGCGVTCSSGQVCCQGECADLQTASDHCGSCGNDCGADACCSGVCATTNDNCGGCGTVCGGDDCCSEVSVNDHECVVACKLYDNDNCGSCGNSCALDQLCCQGVCSSTSDFTDDEQNCGACELACDADTECCLNSECVDNEGYATEDFCGSCEPCESGQCCFMGGDGYQCQPTTIGTEDHCSGCHDACGQNECCVSGVCTTVDFENNPDHCGTCGTDCGDNCCRDSACVSPGDLSSDPQNCGSCGVVCDDECCSSVCADTATDENNCGSCDYACESGQVCQEGFCIDQPSCIELQHVMGDQYRIVDVPCTGPCACDTFACADGQTTCTLPDGFVWYPTGGFETVPTCALPDQVRWVFEDIDPLPTLPEFGTAVAAYMVSLLCGDDPTYEIIEPSPITFFSAQLSRKRSTIVVQTLYWNNGLNWVDACTGCDPSCRPGQTCHTGMLAVGYRSIESTTGQPGTDPVGPSPAPSPSTTGSQSPPSTSGAAPSPATGTTTGSTGSSTAASTTTTGLPPASPASVVHVSASVLLFLFAALLALF